MYNAERFLYHSLTGLSRNIRRLKSRSNPVHYPLHAEEGVKDITVRIERFNPEQSPSVYCQPFTVSVTEQSTVLEALIQIYEQQDSSLAFDHGCRVKNCGLCAVTVNGKPRFACVTRIPPNATIGPLEHLPLIKDFIIDREPFFVFLQRFRPYIIRTAAPVQDPETLIQPKAHAQLMNCRECFSCLSTCPHFDHRIQSFGGPLGFVKLAQLHYDVRDSIDRIAQAREMGIARCAECKGCTCIAGIPIKKLVIEPFLKSSGVY